MIARFLKFTLRKDITKKNKSINHVAFLKSMTLKNKTIYQAKYHKKKLIASIILAAVIYTYDLQKSIGLIPCRYLSICVVHSLSYAFY
jgi:hypothetical protein